MLGSRADAEEALQVTFASAYRALLADERPVVLRPWLFAIARNQCLSVLRRRHPTVELEDGTAASSSGEPTASGDLFHELELREEIRHTLAGVRELPEGQRAAMVLAELHGLSQSEIGSVLGLRPEQVKALVYQARSSLISERTARDADCREIREELDTARGAALLKGKLRKHVRACPDCRTYADGMSRRRRGYGAFLPLLPWLSLKLRTLQDAISGAGAEQLTYAGGTTLGGTVAGAALVAGGPIKAIAVKVAAGAALLGLSTGLGAPVLSTPSVAHHSGVTAALVAKPAWLPLLGESEGEGETPSHSSAATGAGGAVVPAGDHSAGGAGVPSVGGEGIAGGDGSYGGGGASGSSGPADGSPQHGGGGGGAARRVAGASGGAVAGAGAGAGGAAAQGRSGSGQHHGQSHASGSSSGSGVSGEAGESGEAGSSGKSGHAGGSGGQGHQKPERSPSGHKGQPKGNGSGGGHNKTGGEPGQQKSRPTQREREQSRAQSQKTRVEERKAREKEHKVLQREHQREQHAKEQEKVRREKERARGVAQHEKEREHTKKQKESSKQHEAKKREREKNKRNKGRSVHNRRQEAEAAT